MNKVIQEETAWLKREVPAEHGIDPEDANLPPDVRRWVELIHKHLDSEELDISWLKNQTAGTDISGKFKAVVGLRPIAYIRKLRVEWAKKLFRKGYRDCREVAMIVGYRHRSSLSKAFKKQTDISPEEYIQYLEKFTE